MKIRELKPGMLCWSESGNVYFLVISVVLADYGCRVSYLQEDGRIIEVGYGYPDGDLMLMGWGILNQEEFKECQ
jgi:hypothetical protein